ncbi:recombination regulator RecX [Bacillus pumilus]|uniref:recombination regulator RecX n=1 Tax=Bacillus pumilus TaxID=1408 RepID=UPI000F880F86|nr:recombination regulator RecX [Bacillus pumilus]RST63980.1 recombination regulator RecX [Bacillus pumilus]WHX45702.1 recombination regulator RecX [Bacillus pumilus]
MPYITKISAQKNNTERVNIFLDEKYAFSVDLDVLVQHDLKKGKELDEADVIDIQFGDAVKKGFQQAVDYLSYRMRSVKEVTDYLTKKEIPAPAISEIIHKLKHYKYVNDLEFAEAYVNTHRKTNSKGPSVLKKELKLKGIDDDNIEQALSQYPDDLQLEEAVKQVQKLVRKEKNRSAKEIEQRIKLQLQRKGFSFGIIDKALQEAYDGQEEEKEEEALLYMMEKAKRKVGYDGSFEKKMKVKQFLFRKGFDLDTIDHVLDKGE